MKFKAIIVLLFGLIGGLVSLMCDTGRTPKCAGDVAVKRGSVLSSRRVLRKDDCQVVKIGTRKTGEARMARDAKKSIEEWDPFKVEKPSFDFDEEQEAQLSEELKGLLMDINRAMSSPDVDRKKVYSAVQRLISSIYGSSTHGGARGSLRAGVSSSAPYFVKEAALGALRWIGSDAIAETIPFVSDADPQVVEIAKDALLAQMMDFDAKEVDLVNAIKLLAQVDLEPGQYESMMFTLSSFKNSHKVDVALSIYDTGTEAAFEALSKNVDFIFDQSASESIQTKEDIIQYGKDHPDGKDDLDFNVFSTAAD